MEEEQLAPSGMSDEIARRQRDKEMMREAFGDEVYERLYDLFSSHRRADPPTEPSYNEIKSIVGNVRALLNLAMKLDSIIFKEMVLERLPSMAQL